MKIGFDPCELKNLHWLLAHMELINARERGIVIIELGWLILIICSFFYNKQDMYSPVVCLSTTFIPSKPILMLAYSVGALF